MNRHPSVIYTTILIGICLFMTLLPANGENATERPVSESRVHLLHADRLYYDEQVHSTAKFLVGNVSFSHDGILMYCDSALFYEASNSFDAYGNVRLLQGDTLSLDGDVLYYNGMDQLARVRYNVVLRHRESTLYTDSLDYDKLYNLGYFFEGGRLLDKDNELTSDWGEYSPNTREAIFNYNVRLVNPAPPQAPQTILLSDSLHYNTRTAIAHIVGPSNIDHGESHIYSELGYYNTQTEVSYMLNRSILSNNGKRMVGDSVVWEGSNKIGKAFGNVVYTDEINKNAFTGNYCYYDDKIGYTEAADSAMIMDYSQKDTLFAHADTFKVFTFHLDTDSVYRVMHGYHHFRAYRTDMQAVCDSLVYNSQDSCMTMYRDPILWQGEQQIFGEEIQAFFNDSTLDSMIVLRQAMTIEKLDSIHYNQVSARSIHSYFKNGEISDTKAEGNVLVNFYPFDEDSIMIEMNHTETTLLKLHFKDKKINYIWMPSATGTMYPIPLIPSNALYLDGFSWFDYIRPQSRSDIFVWRPKKSGTELKATSRRQAPKQKLSEIKTNR